MKIVAALIAGLTGAAATPASACHTDPFSFKFGSDTSTHVTLHASEACRLGFHIDRRSHMQSAALVSGPQHGTLSQVDATHWLYRPARGYAGADQVVARASGDYMGNRITLQGDSNITYTLDVSP